MNHEHTNETTQTPPEESTPERSTLSGTSLFDADHNDLKVYLKNTQVKQSVLDEYLLSGFQMVQKYDRELRQVAQALKLLLELGARWKDGALLENQMTLHHLICQSKGDNHELLDLIITCFDGTLINSKSHDGSTALLYAVQNANLKCTKSLITNGANVNIEDKCDACCCKDDETLQHTQQSPIVETIRRLQPDSQYSPIVMRDILDLLLDSGVNVKKPYCRLKIDPIVYAIAQNDYQSVEKLIEKGARLDANYNCNTTKPYLPVWAEVAVMGSVELLKCMLDRGLDKESTDNDCRSLLSHVVESCDLESIRYLLDQGVSMTSAIRADEISCKHCGKKRLLIDVNAVRKVYHPYMVASDFLAPQVVSLLEEYGYEDFKSMNALIYAVTHDSDEVVEHLLPCYVLTYPLNVEYAVKTGDNIEYKNILVEACLNSSATVVMLLLDHGADPRKSTCEEKCLSALNAAISSVHTGVVARFIKFRVDVNARSYWHGESNDKVLPFEAAVLRNDRSAALMLHISGCSCGVFSLDNDHKFKKYVKPELKELMKKWNVQEYNVTSLQVQCRRMILRHLSFNAYYKTYECSLPQSVKLYLGISEINKFIEEDRESDMESDMESLE